MSNIYLNYIQIAPIIFDENIIQIIFLLISKKTGIIRCSIYTTNDHWQAVRKQCGQWSWTQNGQPFVGNMASGDCATANLALTTNAFYLQKDGVQVPVDSGITESIIVGLWSNALLA